jgi:D-alanyl-D-alanine carboxypeptidase
VVGAKVLVANPALLTPFADAGEITVSGRDRGTIAVANGYGSHGEPMERLRGSDGEVCALRFAGGTLVPEARVAAELASPGTGAEGGPGAPHTDVAGGR